MHEQVFNDGFVGNRDLDIPLEFFEDWLKVAADEALHFSMWNERLGELGTNILIVLFFLRTQLRV